MVLKFVSDIDLDNLYKNNKFYEALNHLSKDRNNIFKIIEASSEDFPAFTGNGYLPDDESASYNYEMALLNLKSLLFTYTKNNKSFFYLKPNGLDLKSIPKEDLVKYVHFAENYGGNFFDYK